MTRFVVDASVVVKWFLPEEHTESALRLLNEGFDLSSPDLVRAEVGNVMWKRWRRGEISAEEAGETLRHFGRLPLRIQTSGILMETAWSVARRFDRSFYDGVYVALAERVGYPLVTADRKLYNALRESDLAEPLVWVEEIDAA
ncbi:MAG: type II toxin-antitoxin system VapC family toxin [Rubrobacter sp.]